METYNPPLNSRKGHCGFTTTHGLRRCPEYGVWNTMKSRCLNPKNKKYSIYGGRGITITPRWMEFQNFISDMGWRPSPNHTLERKNTDGNYNPYNCVWRTMKDQCRNKRNNVKVTIGGETKCLKAWTEERGLQYNTVRTRLKRGWSIEKAFT